MGGIIAKLDSNNKIVSLKSDQKLSSNIETSLINYYNNYGIIRVKLNLKKIDSLIDYYLRVLSKKDNKLEGTLQQNLKMGTTIGLLVIASMGFILLLESENKKVEGFEEIENYEEVENFAQVAQGVGRPATVAQAAGRPVTAAQGIQGVGRPATAAQGVQGAGRGVSTAAQGIPPAARGVQGAGRGVSTAAQGIPPAAQGVQGAGRGLLTAANKDQQMFQEEVEVIIPKIMLSKDRREFIDFLSNNFSSNSINKKIYDNLKDVLDKLVSESNSEIKIGNLITILMRIMIVTSIIDEVKKLGNNYFSEDDQAKFMNLVFLDLMTLIPNDRCVLNENNIIEFNPNICDIKKNQEFPKTECPKSPDPKCPQTESSNTLTIILGILLIIVFILYITKKGSKMIKNLSKLND
jgi:LPXTG-motif cell wall-anchored protein